MKTSLRSIVALVLAVLTSTFITVRGYLETRVAPELGVDSAVAGPADESVPSWLLTPSLVSPASEQAAPESAVKDDNCPTCAVSQPDRPTPVS